MQVGGFLSAEQRLSAEPYRQRALDRDPRAEERKRPRVQRVNRVWSDKERGRARTAMKLTTPTPGFGRGWRATADAGACWLSLPGDENVGRLRVVSVNYLYY